MPPNRELALELYRKMAPRYDRGGARWPFDGLRRRAVALLALKPGDSVLDVGCGTGLAFPLLEDAIGSEGRIIGIDQSPHMLAMARKRVEANGWPNITLIESSIEEATIPVRADAALFALSHDIMRSPRAVENVIKHVRPGGRISVAGMTWNPWWAFPFNLVHAFRLRRGATTYEGLSRPWTHLQALIPLLQVKRVFGAHHGGYYLAWGARA